MTENFLAEESKKDEDPFRFTTLNFKNRAGGVGHKKTGEKEKFSRNSDNGKDQEEFPHRWPD